MVAERLVRIRIVFVCPDAMLVRTSQALVYVVLIIALFRCALRSRVDRSIVTLEFARFGREVVAPFAHVNLARVAEAGLAGRFAVMKHLANVAVERLLRLEARPAFAIRTSVVRANERRDLFGSCYVKTRHQSTNLCFEANVFIAKHNTLANKRFL